MAEEKIVKNTNSNKKNNNTKSNNKKKTKKKTNVKKNNAEQLKRVDSYVEEIERTNNFKKIDIEEIEKQEEIERQTKLKEESNETVEESIEKEFSESKEEDIKDLKTNGYDLKFDDERLTELDSLDTSFLEGRINKKSKEKKAKKINDSLKKDNIKEKVERNIPFSLKASLLVLCIICGVILVAVASAYQLNSIKEDKKKTEEVNKKNTSKEINKDKNEKKIVSKLSNSVNLSSSNFKS